MKVSVSLITYNHERFIAQAIEGVLMQRTSFPFELVIGEDESSDRTREIVMRYAEAHPDLIRVHLHSRANNLSYQNRATGRRNFVHNLRSVRGEYVALLDGDDYWTDPEKLQVQADFLDAHPECSTCFHRVARVDESGAPLPADADVSVNKLTYTLSDLLGRRFFANTASVMFRRGLFPDFPDWYFDCPVGDFPLHVLNGLRGDFGMIDREMAAYRIHGGGIWSAQTGKPGETKGDPALQRELRQLRGVLHLYEILSAQLPPHFAADIHEATAFYQIQMAHRLRHLEDWPALRSLMRTFIRSRTIPRDISLASIAALIVQGHVPWTARVIDRAREAIGR